ncbi:unnamed protein product [Linum tenue]|uniref:DYW domain-containing protein n=1 Tax=Linum tenue TaxID=586396 RepID=A0AAV0J855_9ROSI|nr:unnamed protein product [Linum tenue]
MYNTLITGLLRHGVVEDAKCLFHNMKERDSISWTTMITGFVQNGLDRDALNRAGLVERGYRYFESMSRDHGILPIHDHYTCMIDLLSRAGRIKEAQDFIHKMPFPPDAVGWATLLSSCRVHSNLEVGKWAAESLLDLEPTNPAGYILLSSIYAAKGKWNTVAQLRRGMREKGLRKDPGCSWIKFKNKLYIFSADDFSSPYYDQIYAELEKLNEKMIQMGYVPDASSVLHDVEELEKIKMLGHHSERLAIAFGLIFIPRHCPIRIVKNLRVCRDCHNATKYISKITQREILVRDAVRFHLFKDGACSCGDFW